MSFLFAFAFKGIRRCVKSPNSLLFGYRQIAINGKYLWALPTPTTFEKVDQTFIIAWKINLLNHNLLMLSQIIL